MLGEVSTDGNVDFKPIVQDGVGIRCSEVAQALHVSFRIAGLQGAGFWFRAVLLLEGLVAIDIDAFCRCVSELQDTETHPEAL